MARAKATLARSSAAPDDPLGQQPGQRTFAPKAVMALPSLGFVAEALGSPALGPGTVTVGPFGWIRGSGGTGVGAGAGPTEPLASSTRFAFSKSKRCWGFSKAFQLGTS
jgi:hypothetical protein